MKLNTLVGLLFLVVVSAVQSQPMSSSYLDIFALPSTSHTTVVEGKGYFPVVSLLEEELFVVFRSGAGHLGKGGALESCISYRSGKKWYAPQPVVDNPQDDRNPALTILPDGRILVAYHEQGSYDQQGKFISGFGNARTMITGSDDKGNTWHEPQAIEVEGLESCSPYGKIVQLGNGELLMNVYGPYTNKVPGMSKVRKTYPHYAYLIRSNDKGETWGEPSLIAPGHNETALLQLKDGRLLAAARSCNLQRIDITFSEDKGKTWLPAMRLTDRMQHPADIIQLKNDWLMIFFGDRSRDEKSIRAILSRDGGVSWDLNNENMVFSPHVRGDFGYPSAAILPNGSIAVLYYWAGADANAYDPSNARLYATLFDQDEFIDAYTKIILDE